VTSVHRPQVPWWQAIQYRPLSEWIVTRCVPQRGQQMAGAALTVGAVSVRSIIS